MAAKTALPEVPVRLDERDFEELREAAQEPGTRTSGFMSRRFMGPMKEYDRLLEQYETELDQFVRQLRGGKSVRLFQEASSGVKDSLGLLTKEAIENADTDPALKAISSKLVLIAGAVGNKFLGKAPFPDHAEHLPIYEVRERLAVLLARIAELQIDIQRQQTKQQVDVTKNRGRQATLLQRHTKGTAQYNDAEIAQLTDMNAAAIPELRDNEEKYLGLKQRKAEVSLRADKVRNMHGDLNTSIDTSDRSIILECIRQIAAEVKVSIPETRTRLERLGVGVSLLHKEVRPQALPKDLPGLLQALGLPNVPVTMVTTDANGNMVYTPLKFY